MFTNILGHESLGSKISKNMQWGSDVDALGDILLLVRGRPV